MDAFEPTDPRPRDTPVTAPLAVVSPRRLATRGSATVGVKAAALTLQAVQFAVVARSISVATFSSYAAATALLVIVGTVAEFGLIQTGVVYMADGRPVAGVVRASIRATAAMIVAATAIIGILTAVLLRGEARLAVLLLLPGFIVARADTPFVSSHIFQLRTTRIAVADLVSRAVLLLAALPLLRFGDSLPTGGVFALLGLGLLLCEITSVLIVAPGVSIGRRSDSFPAREMLLRSLPIGLTNTTSLVHSRSDQVLLDTLRMPVAGYSIAARINEAVLALVNAAGLVSLGSTARAAEDDRPHTVRQFTGVAALVGFVSASITVVFAPQLMNLIGGTRYEGDAVLLILLAPGLAASVMNLPLAQAAILAGQAVRLFRFALIGISVNLLLTVGLVLTIGTKGAAVATSITEVLGLIFSGLIAGAAVHGVVPWRVVIATPTLLAAWICTVAVAPEPIGTSAGILALAVVLTLVKADALYQRPNGLPVSADTCEEVDR